MSKIDINFNKQDISRTNTAFSKASNNIPKHSGEFTRKIHNERKRILEGSPWTVGGGEGGIPRDTGQLRADHKYELSDLESKISVDNEYAPYVHKGRPWLNYAQSQSEKAIEREQDKLLENIISDMAS